MTVPTQETCVGVGTVKSMYRALEENCLIGDLVMPASQQL